MQALRDVQKESAKETEELGRRYAQLGGEVERRSRDMKNASDAQLKSLVELERAQAAYAKAVRDTSSTEAQRELASRRVAEAEKEYTKAIEDTYQRITKVTRASIDRRVAEASASAEGIAKERERIEVLKRAEAAEIQIARERQRRAKETAAAITQAEREIAREIERVQRDNQRRLEELDRRDEQQRRERRRREEVWARQDERDSRAAAQEKQQLMRTLDAAEADSARRRQQWREQELREIQNLERRRAELAQQRQNSERDYLRQLESTARAEQELDRARRARAGSTIVQRLEVEAAHAERKLDEIYRKGVSVGALSPTIEVKVDVDRAMRDLDRVDRRTRGMQGGFRSLGQELSQAFQGSTNSIAAFDNVIRGVYTLAIALFFPQLILLATAAGGALAALASSALFAGSAIGGGLVAGIAQAVPALGVLATALSRVKNVIDAVKQANLLNEQQSYQGEKQDRRAADAADTVRAAQDRVADAHRRVAAAQKNLSEAREEAREKLEDLILAERGATLSAEEAQRALRRAIAEGQTGDIDRARLRVAETGVQARRTTGELRERRAGGIEGSPEVTRAQEQLQAAQRSVEDANRALVRSRRSADEAAEGVTAAAGKLNFLLGNLSDAERRLYGAITRLQEVWSAFAKEISEPLIGAFTFAIGRVTDLLGSRELIEAARSLSQRMATQFRRVFSIFTSPEIVGQFARIAEQAGENLGPITTIITNLGRAFLNIAEIAAPALSRILGFFEDISASFLEFTGNVRVQRRVLGQSLGSLFGEGVKHFEAWIKLGFSVLRLFFAIGGPGGGADTGLRFVTKATEAINNLTDEINRDGSEAQKVVRRIFEVTEQVIGALGPIFRSLGRELGRLFGPEGMESFRGFVVFFADILIPAFGDFLIIVGKLTGGIARFAEQHPGVAKLVSAFLGFGLVFGVVGKVVGLFSVITRPLGIIATRVAGLVTQTARWGTLMTRVATIGSRLAGVVLGPIGLIVGAVVLLLARFGLLDDVIDGVVNAFRGFFQQISRPFRNLVNAFREAGEELGLFGGGAEGALDAAKPLFQLLVRVAVPVLRLLARLLGITVGNAFNVLAEGIIFTARVIGGIIRIIRGLADVLIGLVTGDFDQVMDGLRGLGSGFASIGRALVRAFLAPFRIIGETLSGLFSAVWEAIEGILGNIDLGVVGTTIAEGFTGAFSGIADVIGTIFDGVLSIIEDAVNIAIDALNFLIDAANRIPGVDIGKIDDVDFVGGRTQTPKGARETAMPRAKRREGGRIGEGYGGGDRVHLIAEEGEWVIRKEAVSHWGEGVMAFINSLGGQLLSRGPSGGRFQEGGRIRGDRTRAEAAAQINIDFNSTTEEIRDFVRDATRIFRLLQRNTDQIQDRMGQRLVRGWRNIRERVVDAARDLERGVRRSLIRLNGAVYASMSYIGTTTNEALKAFDADPIEINVRRPSSGERDEGRATGGFIGSPGERGPDRIRTWLGRGEAVLNYAQQAAVNSLLPGQTTLADVMGRISGYHAGGFGQRGFATGRIVPIPNYLTFGSFEEVASGVLPILKRLFKLFGAYGVTDAFDRDRSAGHRSPGHNLTGTAVDIAAKNGNWEAVNKIVRWATSRGFTVYYDGRFGSTNLPPHGEGHHAHIEFGGAGPQALDDLPEADIKAPKVTGTKGPLLKMVQNIIKKVMAGAKNALANVMPEAGEGGYFSVEEGSVAETLRDVWSRMNMPFKALLSAIETGIVETGLRNLPYGDRDSVGWRQERGHYGSKAERMNVGHGAQRFFREWSQFNDPGESAGTVAQQVQRSAFPARYDAARGRALRVIRRLGVDIPPTVDRYAEGGILPGSEGEPLPIVAHAGEWILNRIQQARLASIAGMSIDRVKDMLGFRGGPTHFQEGGEVPPERMRLRAMRRGEYALPDILPIDITGIRREVTRLFRSMRNIDRKSKDYFKSFSDAVSELTREGGLLDLMTQAIERSGAGRALRRAQGRFRQGGRSNVRGREVPTIINQRGPQDELMLEIRDTTEQLADFYRLRRVITQAQRRVNQDFRRVRSRIKALEAGGITADEKKEYETLTEQFEDLTAQRRNLADRLRTANEGIQAALQEIFEKQLEAFQTATEAAIEQVGRESIGGVSISRETQLQLAESLGTPEQVAALQQKRIGDLQEQFRIVQEAQAEAQRRGYTEYATQLGTQLEDLWTEIQMASGEGIRLNIEAINATAERALARTELRGRFNELRGRLGDTLGAAQGAIGIERERGGVLGQQRTALLDQIGGRAAFEALAAMDPAQLTEVQRELVGSIEQLDGDIRESSVNIIALTAQLHQTSIDIIRGTTSRTTGLLDSASTIFQRVGELTGNVDNSMLLRIARQVATTLGGSAQRIANEVAATIRDAASIKLPPQAATLLGDLRAAFMEGPQSFAAALANLGPRLSQLMEGLPPETQAVIQSLIDSMVENTTAVLDNTGQIQELSGAVREPQTFTSSAWTMFRQAIFTGMGQVLPQYEIPQMASGGLVTKGGIFELHTGEFVRKSDASPTSQEYTINIEHPVEVADPVYLAKRIAFENSVERVNYR
jgi:phage-related protein